MSGIFRGLGAGGGGSGDVVGPASSTNNAIARYDGTTGKILQNSSATLDDIGLPTFPNMPGVLAYYLALGIDVTGDGTAYTLVPSTIPWNDGSMYNSTTGVITYPNAGLWTYSLVLTVSGLTSSHTSLTLDLVSSVFSTVRIWQTNPWVQAVSGTYAFSTATFFRRSLNETISTVLTVSGGTKAVDVVPNSVLITDLIYRR